MNIKEQVMKKGFISLLYWMLKEPENRTLQIMDKVDAHFGDKPDTFERQRWWVRHVLEDKDSPMHEFVMELLKNTDADILVTFFVNFFFNASLLGNKLRKEAQEKYHCNIPWAILLDPTSACNLRCTGCWAADYGHKLNLSYEELDSIIEQGKELGVHFYIFTGGEPTVRKDDIIKLCEKHSDCEFLAFTNGTLIDEEFADRMLKVKNFVPAISIEGFEEATDSRRGEGVYQRVQKAMQIMKDKRLAFGNSCCYTSANYKSITSEEFIDSLIDAGSRFVWFFHYMPVGKDAPPELLPTAEQREYVINQLRSIRGHKKSFLMDFQNDGEFVNGCIAGGKEYFHINANGDCEPCVFIHYSNANIREKSLIEVLQSPIFMAYHDNQPFNDNHFRPCPMLENPENIVKMVHETAARSTDLEAPEPVEDLYEKTRPYADQWTDRANELWEENLVQKKADRERVDKLIEADKAARKAHKSC